MASEVYIGEKKPLSHSIKVFAIFLLVAGLIGAIIIGFVFTAPDPYSDEQEFNAILWLVGTFSSIIYAIPFFYWSRSVKLSESILEKLTSSSPDPNTQKAQSDEQSVQDIPQERTPGEPLF